MASGRRAGKAIPETGVNRVAQQHRCGVGGRVEQELTGSLQTKPAAGCAASTRGITSPVKMTAVLA